MTIELERLNPKEIIQGLREKGIRITKVRSAMIDIFWELREPISARALTERLRRRNLEVNKTTIYRELSFLVDSRLVREIDLMDGSKRYEFRDPASHHHHLVCTACSRVQCVELPNDLAALERHLSQAYHFQIQTHVLEFFGLCSDCSRAR